VLNSAWVHATGLTGQGGLPMVRRRSTVRFRNGAPPKDQVRSSLDSSHPTLRMGVVTVLGGIWEIVGDRVLPIGRTEAGGSREGQRGDDAAAFIVAVQTSVVSSDLHASEASRLVTYGDNRSSSELRYPSGRIAPGRYRRSRRDITGNL
jgi:hypothetical protein